MVARIRREARASRIRMATVVSLLACGLLLIGAASHAGKPSAGGGKTLVFGTQPGPTQQVGKVWAAFTVQVLKNGVLNKTDNRTAITIVSSSGPLSGTTTRTVVGGIATFDDISCATPGTLTVTAAASDTAIAPVVSNPVNVLAPNLVFGVTPGTTQRVGKAWSPFTVQVMLNGMVDGSDNVTRITIVSSGGTISGTTTRTVVGGIATFNDISCATAGTLTVTAAASDPTIAPVVSNPVNVLAPTLAFGVPPEPAQRVGRTWAPFTVQVMFNGAVDGSDNNLLVTVVSSSGPLSGTTTKTVAGGVATFSDISSPYPGSFTVTATASDPTIAPVTSGSINVSSPTFAFGVQPGPQQAVGRAWAPFTVQVLVNGAVDTDDNITQIAIGGALESTTQIFGTTVRTVVNGVATFDDISSPAAGTVVVMADQYGAPIFAVRSNPVTVGTRSLAFATQPGSFQLPGRIWSPFSVQVLFNGVVDNAYVGPPINLVVAPGSTTGVGGMLSQPVVGGVAAFNDISSPGPGTVTLTATTPDASIMPPFPDSNPVTVGYPRLVFSPQPASPQRTGQVWAPFSVRVMVDNVLAATDNTTVVALGASGGATAPLMGTLTRPVSGGVATFGDISYPVGETITVDAFSTNNPDIQPPYVTSGPVTVLAPFSVVSTSPTGPDVPVDTTVTARFSMAVDASSVNSAAFYLSGPSGTVAGTYGFQDDNTTVVFTPANELNPMTSYTAYLTPGIRSALGDPLSQPASWSFTTRVAGWTGPFVLGPAGSDPSDGPVVAMNGGGTRGWVLWADGSPASAVMAAQFTAPWMWSPMSPLPGASSGAGSPSVAADEGEMAAAVWRQSNGSTHEIRSATFTPSTGWVSGPGLSNPLTDAGRPSVSMNATGSGTAVWTQVDNNAARLEIAGANCLGGGWVLMNPIFMAQLAYPLPTPSVAVNDNMFRAVVYDYVDYPGTPYRNAFGAVIDPNGWSGGNYPLGYPSDISVSRPVVGWDRMGGSVAAWRAGNTVFASNGSFGGWMPSMPLDSGDTSVILGDPGLGVGADGSAVVAWSFIDNTYGYSDILVSRFDPLSRTWSYPEPVPAPFGSRGDPRAVVDDKGNVWVAFEVCTAPGSCSVYAARRPAGGFYFEPSMAISAVFPDIMGPDMTVDDLGNVTVVWREGGGAAAYSAVVHRYLSGR